jgi:hypothetical protein
VGSAISRTSGHCLDDNIFISNTDPVADEILGVTGGVSFIYGDWRSKVDNFLVADYEAGGFFYFNNPEQDSFNQIASLSGQVRFQRLAILLRSQYAHLTGAVRDVGGFATRNLIYDTLRFTYDLSTKTSLWAEGFVNLAIYKSFFNSYEFGVKAGGDYQILQKVRVGPEFVMGFLDVADSPNKPTSSSARGSSTRPPENLPSRGARAFSSSNSTVTTKPYSFFRQGEPTGRSTGRRLVCVAIAMSTDRRRWKDRTTSRAASSSPLPNGFSTGST